MKLASIFACASLLTFALVAGARDSDAVVAAAGPIDGAYTVSTWTCGGVNVKGVVIGSGLVKLNVNNSSGTQVVALASGCTKTNNVTFAYSGLTVIQTEGAYSSTASCSAPLTGTNTAVSSFGYVAVGSTLTLTRTLTTAMITANDVLANASCANGSTETLTLTK